MVRVQPAGADSYQSNRNNHMKYLIVQNWASTSGNHTGMVHMCHLLSSLYPNKYKVAIMDYVPQYHKDTNVFKRKLLNLKYRYCDLPKLYRQKYLLLCKDIFSNVRAGDEFFLLEYLLPNVPQYDLAVYIRTHYPYVQIYGLVHLTPTYFNTRFFVGRMIRKWAKPIDKVLTLGTGLSSYLCRKGHLPKYKISTGFHYVDLDYYHLRNSNEIDKVTIIVMGNLQRDFHMIASIVRRLPEFDWIICQGRAHYEKLFADCQGNVSIKGYLEESELRHLMSISDLSLNVMQDTVGSNVVTTSMAMGLGMVVSDVGSIHDYCTVENAVFCKNDVDSFVYAIKMLSADKERIKRMKNSSYIMAERFNIKGIDKWFDTLRG